MKGNTKAATPREYLQALPEPRKTELTQLTALVRKTTGLRPTMFWGMIGYGKFHYTYASGREGEWCAVALASQKNYISLYACMGVNGKYVPEHYKTRLPKASIGKSCVRFKKLSDVNLKIIAALLKENHKAFKAYKPGQGVRRG
jgi:hypothetical protein